MNENEGERCARCGHVGYDRRTLIVACFYALKELDIPFEETAIEGVWQTKIGERPMEGPLGRLPNGKQRMIPMFEASPKVTQRQHRFYTLRICKDCRGQWMDAMEHWFRTVTHDDTSPGSGIFVREHGRNVEISREEWDRR